MPWHLVTRDGRVYVADKDGKLTPAGGYPNTPEGKKKAHAYMDALYANAKPGEVMRHGLS